MKEYEVAIEIIDEKYIDSLVVSLVRQGYEVYYIQEDDIVCFKTYGKEVREIKKPEWQ